MNDICTYLFLIDAFDGDYASSHFRVVLLHLPCALMLPINENKTLL